VTDHEGSIAEAAPAQRPLSNPDDLLFRQIHPAWIDDGVPSSQAFKPTRKDDGMLSIALGGLSTAEGAFVHHTTVLKLASIGSWGVSVAEVSATGLTGYAEPLADSPAHGFIDFRELTRGQVESKAKVLLAGARARGRLHPAA
jgi:hypothetical protein